MATIVDTAVSAGSFTKLVDAVKAAGLGETLSGPGPFTVFAPGDDAFDKLPAGTMDALLSDIPKLTDILKYHVVAGRYTSSDITSMMSLRSLEGQDISISTLGGIRVGDARVVKADIETDNGLIHVIDSVMMPG